MATTQQIKGTEGQIQNNNLEQKVVSEWKGTKVDLEPGKSITTMLPGILYPIQFKEVLAGEKIISWDIDNITRILTPLVPTMDQVFIDIKAFFVPHTRVWKDAEKVLANKYDMEATQVSDYGYNTKIPSITVLKEYTKNWTWKETLLSRYGAAGNKHSPMKYNVLLPRGYRAIWNDYIRNKEYQLPKPEWNDNEVTAAEEKALLPYNTTAPYGEKEGTPVSNGSAYITAPAAARKSYLTNIKRSIQTEAGILDPDGTDLMPYEMPEVSKISNHLDWQTKFMDQKQRIDNANKTDWEIIAEMGGTKPVRADRVEYLGKVSYELNYQQITQSTPQIDNSSPLGTTGSFSYSKATGTLFNYKEFQQHGYIHILASITIPKVYDNGVPKELLKLDASEEIYRPGQAKKEIQFLKKEEIGLPSTGIAAYQPAWAEYKRMPSIVTGEMKQETYDIDGTKKTTSYAHWHNAVPATYVESANTINGEYFTPYREAITVLARNNILNYPNVDITNPYGFKWGLTYTPDMIMNMGLHKVTTILPITRSVITGKSKAEQTR